MLHRALIGIIVGVVFSCVATCAMAVDKLPYDFFPLTYWVSPPAEDARYAEAYMNRGYCNEMIRNTEEAKTDYKMVLTLKPNFDKAVEGLNRIDAKK